VWNEPGVAPTFWTGTKEQYFQLYLQTTNAFKAVSRNFQVGGPATDCCAAWIEDLIVFCKQNNISIDFVSTHTYPGGETNIGNIDSIVSTLKQSKRAAGNLPLVITEWSSSYVQNWKASFHDEPGSAPFLVATMQKAVGLADVFSYWAFSDVFEEAGFASANISFYGGFGLLNFYGVPKPAFRAFQLLHQAGDQQVTVNQKNITQSTCRNTGGLLALRNSSDVLFLLYNHNVVGAPISDCTINVTVTGLINPPKSIKQATIIRIDEQNTNPKAKWLSMGKPEYLTKQQIDVLKSASVMIPNLFSSSVVIQYNGSTVSFSLPLPKHGLAAINIPL